MNNSNVMIRLASAKDSTRWDEFVDNQRQASPYHKMAWLHAVKNSYNYTYFAILAECKESQEIKGVFPVVLMTTPFKGASLCALPYCDLGGPLANCSNTQEQLIQFAVQLTKKHNAHSLHVRASAIDDETGTDMVGKKVRMLLPLPDSSETLLASFKSKLRSQIRKAEKNGLTFQLGNNTQLLEHFYQVYCINMRDLGSPAHHKDWFSEIIACYGDNAIISVVYHENLPIGGGIVLFNQSVAAIPWASTVQAYNKLAPNMLLYWSLLAHCADKPIHTFDFGRSTFNEGTYKFKQQWGAKPSLLNWQRYLADGSILDPESTADTSPNSSLRERVENIWRKLPLPVTIFIGGKIRKYISL